DLGTGLQIAFRAGRDHVVDEIFSGHPSERTDDPATEVPLVITVAVSVGSGDGDAQGPSARDDRDRAHRIGAGLEHAEERVTAFVVCGPSPFLLRDDYVPRGAELHLFQRLRQIPLSDL